MTLSSIVVLRLEPLRDLDLAPAVEPADDPTDSVLCAKLAIVVDVSGELDSVLVFGDVEKLLECGEHESTLVCGESVSGARWLAGDSSAITISSIASSSELPGSEPMSSSESKLEGEC